MGVLLGFEIKKILKKKSTWAAFLALLAIQTFIAFSGSMGSTYVDEELVETHMERNRIDREDGLWLSGRIIDGELLFEMQAAYNKIGELDYEEYQISSVYQSEVRKYSQLYAMLKYILAGGKNALNITEEELYDILEAQRLAVWDSYELNEKEREYWEARTEAQPDMLTYEYSTAYQYIVGMHGNYMVSMLITFFIAICMGNVFVEEHTRKTDQIILCTRYGRGKLYFAKILAGSIVTLAAVIMLEAVTIAGNFISYGAEGFNAAVGSMLLQWYTYGLTMGEALLITMGLLLLSSILIGIVTMVLAEILHSAIGAMAIIIGGLFAARLVPVPAAWGIISKLWNCIPINLIKIDQGFSDLRLFSLFGAELTIWQFAPLLYMAIGALLVLLGKRVFCNLQITGR